jgi:aryl-alcohol dehydrogenase-like predicted oxidoreductase
MGHVDRSQAVSLIRRAIDAGVTFIDTAEQYGDTERILGEALSEGYRDRCFLATKVSKDFTATGVRRAVERSLRDMRVETIDLYQLHRFDNSVPLEETLGAVRELQLSGAVRHIGVSNFSAIQLVRATETAPVVANQINYSALNRNPERGLLQAACEANVGVLVHSALAKGILTGKYAPGHVFASNDERSSFPGYSGESLRGYLTVVKELQAIAADYGLTMTQGALGWVLAREEVTSVLIGPKTIDQFEESTSVLCRTSADNRNELRRRMDEVLERHALAPLCPMKHQLV